MQLLDKFFVELAPAQLEWPIDMILLVSITFYSVWDNHKQHKPGLLDEDHGEATGEDDGRMNPLRRCSSMYFLHASSNMDTVESIYLPEILTYGMRDLRCQTCQPHFDKSHTPPCTAPRSPAE